MMQICILRVSHLTVESLYHSITGCLLGLLVACGWQSVFFTVLFMFAGLCLRVLHLKWVTVSAYADVVALKP